MSSGTVTTFAGWYSTTWTSDKVFYNNYPATQVGLSGPYSIAFDSVGNLFISNVFRNEIREVVANQAVWNYPNMTVNRISVPQEQIIENDGNANLTITSIEVKSDAVIEPSTTPCPLMTFLAPLGQCAINAQFALSSIGFAMWDYGYISVETNAINSPGQLSLTADVYTSDSTTTTVASNESPANTGDAVRFDISVVSHPAVNVDPRLIAPATTPTGTVSLFDGTAPIASGTLVPPGIVSISVSGLAVGTHTVTAQYPGDANNDPSISQPISQIVRQPLVITSMNLTTSSNPAPSGSQLRLTATILPAASTASSTAPMGGTVVFLDGTSVLGKADVQNSAASLAISGLSVGKHELSATYSGDLSYAPTTSGVISEQISSVTNVAITSESNPSLVLDNVPMIVAVTGVAALPPSGKVVLNDGGTFVASQELNASGTASFVLTSPVLGHHVLSASYYGDSDNLPSSSPAFDQVVILRPTANTLTSTTQSLMLGQSVTLLAVIQGNGPTHPTGNVAFSSGNTVLGAVALSSTGIAQLTLSPAQGMYSLTSTYSGDTIYAASTSAVSTLVVGAPQTFNLSVTPASFTIQTGQHVPITVGVATSQSFSDTLALGCAGLPADATCTFASDTVQVKSGSAATFTVVVDTGDPLGAGQSASVQPSLTGKSVAGVTPGSLFVALLIGLRCRRLRRSNLAAVRPTILILIGSLAVFLSGCASTLNISHTPAGSYTFEIVATGVKTGVTHSAVVQVTVTQ